MMPFWAYLKGTFPLLAIFIFKKNCKLESYRPRYKQYKNKNKLVFGFMYNSEDGLSIMISWQKRRKKFERILSVYFLYTVEKSEVRENFNSWRNKLPLL